MHRNGVAHPWCTLFTKGSRTVTAFTSEGSKPISSLASLMAVSMSSASPSSLFPPGNETSPKTQLTQLMDHLKFEPFSTRKKKKKNSRRHLTRVRREGWRALGENHMEIAILALEKADENSGSIGFAPGRFRIWTGLLNGNGMRRFVETELFCQDFERQVLRIHHLIPSSTGSVFRLCGSPVCAWNRYI